MCLTLEGMFRPSVAWVNDGEHLAVIAGGSSSCPNVANGVEVTGPGELAVTIGPKYPDQAHCTADATRHVTVIRLPGGISPTESLTVHFDDASVTLDPVQG
ncbi:hypothetical protein [Cellulomonas bogoriensis]|uniref:hypothetical protein n=1 Tax=Cellulomonas bogoriensis TaxID=301388 RepID=UPI0012ECA66C|nr:hypothetical protein [Cellulomonas bogoriensis]